MYQPAMFREVNQAVLHELIRDFPFATVMVMHSDGVEISHLPLVLDTTKQKLIGHIAKANPLVKILSSAAAAVTVIFNGEHGYISPSYYLQPEQNVPTWNYAVVHVSGEISLITDEARLMDILDRLQLQYDVKTTDWSNPKMSNKLKGISGFEINIRELRGKFKLSQNKETDEQKHLVQQLAKSNSTSDVKLAEFMQDYLSLKSSIKENIV